MGNRFLKWVSALSVVALVSGVLLVSANAHIGVSHSPIDTDGPDLVTAEITDDDEVTYCFDEPIFDLDAGDEGNFWVGGYDEDVWFQGDAADESEVEGEENCAIVTFDFDDTDAGGAAEGERDLEEFTIAWVDSDTINDRQGNDNVEAAAELGGSEAASGEGNTAGPELVDFDTDEQGDTITYIFDEDLDCDDLTLPTDASSFGFYKDEGAGDAAEEDEEERGNSVVDCDDNEIEIAYAAGEVDNVVRVFYDADGLGDEDLCEEEPSTSDCATFQAEGGDTDDPDLIDAERDEETVTFFFDDEIDLIGTGADFVVVDEAGQVYTGTNCTEEGDDAVECDFVAIEDAQDSELAYAAVDDCAVEGQTDDFGGDPDCNTIGDVPLGTPDIGPGNTAAPDLESCTVDDASDTATFFFDEVVDEDSVSDTGAGFHIVDAAGNMEEADDLSGVDEEAGEVTVEFDEGDDLDEAVGCFVEFGSVADFLGNDNVGTTVGSEGPESPTTATTTTTSVSTSTSTVTTGTGTTGGPVTRRIATALTIRYDRNDNAFKGSVGSSRERCTVGRLVTLHKRGAGSKGTDTSNKRGNWKINKRARDGRWFAQVAKKRYIARNGDTIICKTDESPTIKL